MFAHGFLTVDGQKMSKSRGTFIKASTYLEHLNPEYLRYYFAAKLGSGVDDIDLSLEDFAQRVNSDLVGKYINIASRCAGFIRKRFGSRLGIADSSATAAFESAFQSGEIARSYEERDYGRAIRETMRLADIANQYIDEKKPWVIAKEEGKEEELHQVCTTGLSLFRDLTLYLKPVLPALAEQVEDFLNITPLAWTDVYRPLPEGHVIKEYRHLMTRVDTVQIERMVEASREDLAAGGTEQVGTQSPARHGEHQQHASHPIADTIAYDEFARIDMRVARIVDAAEVPGADKLLQLTLDIGSETRTVFAGIKSAYDADSLKGRLTVMVANLAPRKMRFGVSEGMVLAASDDRGGPYLLALDSAAEPGMKIS